MEALEFQVHRFHGGTYYCGVPRLKVAAEQLELTLKAKDRKANNINILYEVLLKEMKALAKEFGKLNSSFSR